MESVLFIYVFFWVLVWPCQLFVRLWLRVSDVLDLSLVSKRSGFWPHITHVIVLTFKEIKHLSDYRTVGLSDRRTIGLSDYRSDLVITLSLRKIDGIWTQTSAILRATAVLSRRRRFMFNNFFKTINRTWYQILIVRFCAVYYTDCTNPPVVLFSFFLNSFYFNIKLIW